MSTPASSSSPSTHASSSSSSSSSPSPKLMSATPVHPEGNHQAVSFHQGRAPWYRNDGTKHRPFFIGVTGGSASGKTTVTTEIVKRLGVPWVIVLSMDRFYNSLPVSTDGSHDYTKEHNFDHPDAFDWDTFLRVLKELSTGSSVSVPKYSFVTHSRLPESENDLLYGADVIIVEGILVLYDQKIREQLDMKIFVDTDDDIRLARRLQRDVAERGRSVESVLFQYFKTVKPSYEQFIFPSRRHADIIIPWGESNDVAVRLMVEHIRSSMSRRGFDAHESFRQNSSNLIAQINSQQGQHQLPSNVKVLEQTTALRSIHTLIRSSSTSQSDFQFHIHRLSRLLFSEALNALDYSAKTVITPTGVEFKGLEFAAASNSHDHDHSHGHVRDAHDLDVDHARHRLVAVSVVRGGESLEFALRALEPSCQIGKLVITQSESKDHGPRLFYSKLPRNISKRKIILMDGIVATGNVLHMAIQVLLEHGVAESDIIVVCLITCVAGMTVLCRRHPGIRVLTSAIDDLDKDLFLTPGLGSLGKRYFGV